MSFGKNALHFDGVDDQVVAPDVLIAAGSPITIEFWNFVRADEAKGLAVTMSGPVWPERVGCHAPTGAPWNFRFIWDFGNLLGAGRLEASYQDYLDKWTHVALVSQGQGGHFKGIYLDGKLVASDDVSDGPSVDAQRLSIGHLEQPAQDFYRGAIAGLRIWEVVRSAADIEANMRTKLSGHEPGLLCAYDFDRGVPYGDNTGIDVLPDVGPHGWNGRLRNFALRGAESNWVAASDAPDKSSGQPQGAPQSDTGDLETAVIREINEMRADPSAYGEKLGKLKSAYELVDGYWYLNMPEEGAIYLGDSEADKADHERWLDEAIRDLKVSPVLSHLESNAKLRQAADYFASDPGEVDGPKHEDSKGRGAQDRAALAGYAGGVSECIPGGRSTAYGIVAQLLIDWKVESRGHRKNLMKPEAKDIGVACHFFPEQQDGQWVTEAFVRTVIQCGYGETA